MKFGLALVCLGFFASGCATTPHAATSSTIYRPAVDFRSWRSSIAGPTTKVATLGSQHLSELPAMLPPETLAPLLDKLAAFNPTIIIHEGLSGEQCDMIQRHPTTYPEIYADYCTGVMAGVRANGPGLPQARARVEETLKSWPTAPTPAQRRQLISLLLASGDLASAHVQWLYLPVSERVMGDGLDSELLAILAKIEKRQNETNQIGVALAVRLGLQRMYAVDDHTADAIQALAPVGFAEALQAHWARPSNADVPAVKQYNVLRANMNSSEGLLAAFRFLNLPDTQRAFVELDYKDSLVALTPQLFGRRYVAWWEVRNLRMVANIRSAFGNDPGARVLNIVGASHKAYYEAYLAQMSDVELVDMGEILK